MNDRGIEARRVRLWPADAAERLAAELAGAGWSATEGEAELDAVEVGEPVGRSLERLRDAAAGGGNVLALLPNPAMASAALDAGATDLHLLGGGLALADSLRAAARPRRRDRRADDDAEGGLPFAWLAGRLGQGAVTLVGVRLLRLDLVNAAHGRDAGTELIAAAERRIGSVLEALADEDEWRLVRVAGPGFVAALGGPAERAILAAARIEEALDRPFRGSVAGMTLGSRIALAGSRAGDDPAALGARLDRALADAAAPAADPALEALAVDLHRALADGEVRLLFQPQASLATGRIVGVEALARWRHPRLGPLGADRLFAAAEQAGVALALSDHIQRLVLAEVAAWPAPLGALRVALNLTPADLARPHFAETFLDRVDAAGVPRGRLTLEITETGLMTDLPAAASLLADLRAAGCRVAIDDFGTGYSSLAWLKTLPVDYLKLDKALAQDIGGTERDRVVVRGAIDMARSLGIAVVAEGVETERQRALLAAEGCAVFQGFLLAEPLDTAALLAFVEGR